MPFDANSLSTWLLVNRPTGDEIQTFRHVKRYITEQRLFFHLIAFAIKGQTQVFRERGSQPTPFKEWVRLWKQLPGYSDPVYLSSTSRQASSLRNRLNNQVVIQHSMKCLHNCWFCLLNLRLQPDLDRTKRLFFASMIPVMEVSFILSFNSCSILTMAMNASFFIIFAQVMAEIAPVIRPESSPGSIASDISNVSTVSTSRIPEGTFSSWP